MLCYVCKKEGSEKELHYRDFSFGPIGDFRYYCDDHVEWADKELAERSHRNTLQYHVNAIERLMSESQKHLDFLKAELKRKP